MIEEISAEQIRISLLEMVKRKGILNILITNIFQRILAIETIYKSS